jgi:predicted DNA-binding transcriptional regulator AlpA
MTAHERWAASFPPPDPASGRWVTIREIAADLSVSPSTVYKWSARGGPWFPRAIRLRNGDIRVRRDWYETWLADHEPQTAGSLDVSAS